MCRVYRRIDFEERVRISTYWDEGCSVSEISRKLARSKSTISRELRRFSFAYRADRAHAQMLRLSRSKIRPRKLESSPRLRGEVLARLRKRWSPELVSKTLRRDFPGDPSMQLPHDSVYTYIYVLPRGALRAELISLLRQKKKARKNRKGMNDRRGKIPDMISIEERPKAVRNRSVPGDWEGDLIIGKRHKSAIGTLVERKTRMLFLVPIKNRLPSTVRRAFERTMKDLPKQMTRSLTYDQGHEMCEHRLFSTNTKMKVYFCHPASPWERGTCENTNGLIRDYFPKGTDFSQISRKELRRVQDQLNDRPRKTLDYRTPREVFERELLRFVPLRP